MPPEISELRKARLETKIRSGETLTLQETADYLGMWRSTVQDMEQSALRKMRKAWQWLEEMDEAEFSKPKRKEVTNGL